MVTMMVVMMKNGVRHQILIYEKFNLPAQIRWKYFHRWCLPHSLVQCTMYQRGDECYENRICVVIALSTKTTAASKFSLYQLASRNGRKKRENKEKQIKKMGINKRIIFFQFDWDFLMCWWKVIIHKKLTRIEAGEMGPCWNMSKFWINYNCIYIIVNIYRIGFVE